MGFISKTGSAVGSVFMNVSGIRFMQWSFNSTKKTSQKLLVEPAKSVWRSIFWWKQMEVVHESFDAAVGRVRLQVVAEIEEIGDTASDDLIAEEVEMRIADTLQSLQRKTKTYLALAGIAFVGATYITFFGQTIAAFTWLLAAALMVAFAAPGLFRCWQITNRRLGGLSEWVKLGEWFKGLKKSAK